MDRCVFYNVVTIDGVDELDHLWNPMSEFPTTYRPQYYRVEAADLMRPWRISYKCYGTDGLWWVLLAWNGVDNPLTDLTEGMLLEVPNKLDIYNFQKKFKVR